MNGSMVLAWCRAREEATEERPFGPDTTVFKIGGRIFAVCPADPNPVSVTLKADPDLADSLRQDYPGIKPGYHMNKRHWNTVTLDGSVPEAVVLLLLERSYALVARARGAGRAR